MITLPHHVEFLSDAWLEEARKFLTRETKRRETDLEPFSLSERFTHAPPHLGFDDAVASWQVSFDGTDVVISRGFDPHADVVVHGIYQAALMAAQVIGGLAPGIMREAFHEVQHIFGEDALKVSGALKSPSAVEMFGLLHDHLGRRTVENPDLAHRAEQLGVADNVREMDENGYTVIENAISAEFADEVRAATLTALLPHHHFSLQWMLYHGRPFERVAQNPQLMTLIDASLGRGGVIASLSSIRKGPGPGAIPIHTDYSMVPGAVPGVRHDGCRCLGVRRLDCRKRADMDRAWFPQGTPWPPQRGRSGSGDPHRDAEGFCGVLHPRGLALAGRSDRTR